MTRYKKSSTLNREPFDAASTIDGPAIKQVAKEKAFERVEKNMNVIHDLNEFTKSVLYHMNYMMHDFRKLSAESMDWYVDLYYPTAAGGPVYVDMPKSERQLKICEKKAVLMREQKKRYLVYLPKDDRKPDQIPDGLE